MPEVTEMLERLADHPPCGPTPAAEIKARVRRRRQRRRLELSAVAVVSAAVGVVGAVVISRPEPPADLTTEDAASPPGDEPTLTENRGMSLTPSSGHDDGDTVTLTLEPDPGGEVVATQCAAEVLEPADDQPDVISGLSTDWCGSVFYLRSPAAPSGRLEVPITRVLQTREGLVDCAELPGRCVVMAGAGFVGDRLAPLVFAEDLGPVTEPSVTLVGGDGPFDDGETIRVEGAGFAASSEVTLTQCVLDLDHEIEDYGTDACDVARPGRVRADAAGEFAVDIILFRVVITGGSVGSGDTTWVACEPCTLMVTGPQRRQLPIPVTVTATDGPIHPVLRLDPTGPHRPGQRVRVEGEGFQADEQVGIPWCLAAIPEQCMFPDEAFPTTDADGRFVVEDYPLPGGNGLTAACTATPRACVVAWVPSQERARPGVTVPLDLSG